jgi:hypothetical protein
MNPAFHDEAEHWAVAAATGGLSAAELKAWNDHLQACPACQELHKEKLTMADLIKQTLETDRQGDAYSPDAGFEQRIISRLDQVGAGKGNRWYEHLLFHPVLTAAATCLVATAVAGADWMLHRGAPSQVASQASVAGSKPEVANVPASGTSTVSPSASPTLAVAATTPSPAVENPPPAPAKGLSNNEGLHIGTLAPTNKDGQPSFSLTDPSTKYPLGPGTEQKIATIATAQLPAIQGITAITSARDAWPGHHHRHHRHHHKRHRHHHHHPAP